MTEHMSHMSTSNLGHFVIWRRCGLSCEDLLHLSCFISFRHKEFIIRQMNIFKKL